MAPTRLINTKTLDFEESKGQPLRYAILSHRWLDQEVSFHDWCQRRTRLDITHQDGYKKILAFCREARSDGFKYVWVDTNCIEKANSSELSEAINSMFNWYKDASACYVYLHDLRCDEITSFPDLLGRYGSGCEWFSRGWTLQELLAAADVRFYTCDWKFIGLKENLYGPLSKLTGIREVYLRDSKQIFQASISERMSWMSQRQTTKPEDIAYSLIGIFDINMPLLYGEGGIKAFRRLQEEIIRVSTDQTIFAWEWPRGWMSETQDWISLFAPSPAAFRNAAIYSPDDRLLDGPSSLYSISNFGLAISLQILPSCSAQGVTYLNKRDPGQLVFGGLHCVVDYEDSHAEESEAFKLRSLIAIPLLKQGNRYFRIAFPSMPIPILWLWTAESRSIYAPRLRELGSDMDTPINMSIQLRNRLESRYCFIMLENHGSWVVGETACTPFWTKFEDFGYFIGGPDRTRGSIEAIVFGMIHEDHPKAQFHLYLGLTNVNGINRTHCSIERAPSSESLVSLLATWMRTLAGVPSSGTADCGTAEMRIQEVVSTPNGMKLIPVHFNPYAYEPPPRQQWSTSSMISGSSVESVIGLIR